MSPCYGEKMVDKTDVIPALPELTASLQRQKVLKGGSRQLVILKEHLKVSESSWLGTVPNTSYWSQKPHLFSLCCHELLPFSLYY